MSVSSGFQYLLDLSVLDFSSFFYLLRFTWYTSTDHSSAIDRVVFPQECLSPLSMQALPAPSESLCIVEMGGTEAKEETGEAGVQGGLYLNIGLQVII